MEGMSFNPIGNNFKLGGEFKFEQSNSVDFHGLGKYSENEKQAIENLNKNLRREFPDAAIKINAWKTPDGETTAFITVYEKGESLIKDAENFIRNNLPQNAKLEMFDHKAQIIFGK